ncbi:MAG: hypothetical protein WCW78_03680 [Candidatus Paceibacterota bacterium]|jgi:hypothetical protein
MPDTILLNGKKYSFDENDLPCLISYAPKTGGSHFTISMMADLFLSGSKILSFTAYSSAKDNFLGQIKGMESKVAYIESINQLEANKEAQAILLKSGDEKLFFEVVSKIKDLKERVVLVKNIETFSGAVFDNCSQFQKVVISGDIDRCKEKNKIIVKKYKTIVVFSRPEFPLAFKVPTLNKYEGYLWNGESGGLCRVFR